MVYIFPEITSSLTNYTYFKDVPGPSGGNSNEFGRFVVANGFRGGLFAANNESIFLDSNLFPLSAGTVSSREDNVTRDGQPTLSMVAADNWLLRSLDQTSGLQIELVSTLSGSPFQKLYNFDSTQTQVRRDDDFGQALAISKDGDVSAFGAPRDDSGAAGVGGDENDVSLKDAGAVYVYP